MLNISVDFPTQVVSVEPLGSLQESDFKKLDEVIDPLIAEHGSLQGLLIHTKTFPGSADFAGFLANRRFRIDHHKDIAKVALVTDSDLGGAAEAITRLLKLVDARHFAYTEFKDARAWVSQPK